MSQFGDFFSISWALLPPAAVEVVLQLYIIKSVLSLSRMQIEMNFFLESRCERKKNYINQSLKAL